MNNAIKVILYIIILIIARILADKYINSDHIPKDYIHDVCHYVFPKMDITKNINYLYDFFTFAPILLLYGLIIYSKNYTLLLEVTILFITLNVIRPIFYTLTVLPDPTERCIYDKQEHTAFYEFITGTCKEMIFSGHVSNSFLALLLLVKYFGLPIPYAVLHQTILVFLMLCQRKHYTIDIIIAYLVTFILFDKRDYIYDLLDI